MKKTVFDSPIGKIAVSEENGAVISVKLLAENDFPEGEESGVLSEAKQQLLEYFSGERTEFDIPYSFSGTDFQKAVWNELAKIPFGSTKTYGEIALAAGNPKAARAVGSACNKNPLPLIIPCHRVIGSGGKLTGFACGTEIKMKLLWHEATVIRSTK